MPTIRAAWPHTGGYAMRVLAALALMAILVVVLTAAIPLDTSQTPDRLLRAWQDPVDPVLVLS